MSITVRVITPDRIVWDNVAEEVILPSSTGQLGILSGHAPLLTALNIGVMRIRPGKDWENIAVLGGFAEVENNEIKVLVNGAELGSKIDKEKARTEYEQAQTRLDEASKGDDRRKTIQAQQSWRKARARYQAAGGLVSV
ncbi:MAG: F0F1 ATP synthase subunit epsilon [Microcystis panniformis Mp_MB_F_20051200_S9]|jgi:F-type H+-transporting ATPase subunit epsilon|uniref:ATP synthase epsilon chain n=4 Tax=Microcystis TaxID=1125 RepID=A0A841V2K5_MICAE|nr:MULTISPECIES: ATP synthase F1 subunit epsilon [Microcystis]MBE5229490.1 F0F1 ATP synthase subunit epsilon [Microcystis aeruginosa PMC 728.11]MCA2553721.1 F0F1 ATP synthase subunit epsilon [Microcystis sp. M04BS1]MCZ8191700.1 ATP synthase F1 subunit epsilon [Microcystis sp. LE19-338.1B]MCZ8357548.1 ATP synthase F1 subunit epsilon [Microcystis sp. LE19-388.1G]MDY7047270.1 ATP synthase F1 subunit epsilon [Microcystis panniformis WG22]NCS25437.1 F0F1 ATP synthase subunit epsilon [Microcystis a